MRILVIDDEPDVLLLCKVNFEFAGHEVLEAADGQRGIAIAASALPDLIVLDVMLPGKDGFAILAELGNRPETRDIPVVLLTAKVQEDDKLRGWRGGAFEYVTKPFSPLALTETIERVFAMNPEQRRRRRDEALSLLLTRAS